MKGLLENMDQQHAQILKQLRSGQGDKKNKSKRVSSLCSASSTLCQYSKESCPALDCKARLSQEPKEFSIASRRLAWASKAWDHDDAALSDEG